jgi:hypothetical protein
MAERERALEVDEVAHRLQQPVQLALGQQPVAVGRLRQRRAPDVVGQPVQDLPSAAAEGRGDGRVELGAAAAARHRDGTVHPGQAQVHLGDVRQLHHAHLHRNGITPGTDGQPAAVPAFVEVRQRLSDFRGEPHPVGEHARGSAVGVDQLRQPPPRSDRERHRPGPPRPAAAGLARRARSRPRNGDPAQSTR